MWWRLVLILWWVSEASYSCQCCFTFERVLGYYHLHFWLESAHDLRTDYVPCTIIWTSFSCPVEFKYAKSGHGIHIHKTSIYIHPHIVTWLMTRWISHTLISFKPIDQLQTPFSKVPLMTVSRKNLNTAGMPCLVVAKQQKMIISHLDSDSRSDLVSWCWEWSHNPVIPTTPVHQFYVQALLLQQVHTNLERWPLQHGAAPDRLLPATEGGAGRWQTGLWESTWASMSASL